MTVAELEQRMTAREFLEWGAYTRQAAAGPELPSVEENPDAFLASMGAPHDGPRR